MKKNNLLITAFLCLLLVFSCEKPTELVPTTGNNVSAIHFMFPDGSSTDFTVDSGKTDLQLDVPAPINTDPTKVRLSVSVPNNAEVEASVPMGKYMDFTKPVSFTVVGADGKKLTYTINANFIANDQFAVKAILPDGEEPFEGKSSGIPGDTIFVKVPVGLASQLNNAQLEFLLPGNAKLVDPLKSYDLTKPVLIKVLGEYGLEGSYVIKSKIIGAVFEFKELWRKKASEFDHFEDHNHGGIGVSGNYVIPHTRTAFKYYNVADGSFAGTMSWDGCDLAPFPLHLTTDDVGHIFSCNFVPGQGNELRMYVWDNVTAKPELLFKWVSDAPGNLGRKIYVKGDVNELAYVYLTVSNSPMFLRWEVKNGKVTSETPDKVTYTHPNGTWGLQAKLVPTEVSKNSNYFINTEFPNVHITYMDGNNNTALYNSNNISWLGSSHQLEYIELEQYKYLFITEANPYNGFTEIFGITDLVANPASIKDVNQLILHRKWGDWWPVDTANGFAANGNTTGDVKALVAKDGKSAIVAYLVTNVGVKVIKVELKELK